MSLELLVPDIGDFDQVEIIEVLVKKGDNLKKNDPVVTLESDKSSVEVPSNLEGTIEDIKVKIGDKVSKGDLILTISNNSLKDKIPPVTEKIIEEAEQNTKLLIDELQRNISSFSKVNISYEILHGSKISIVNEIIKDKSDIGYLVIASNNQGDSPGELVEFISKSGFSIPVVVIPGDMKSETIDKLVGINK